MNEHFHEIIRHATGAESISESDTIQTLWSGYGKIAKYALTGAVQESVIVKLIQAPTDAAHPRGWNTDISHQRKMKSYQVESAWYQHFNQHCNEQCRTPHCHAIENADGETLIVLEDLDAAGYPIRKNSVTQIEFEACIDWLAHFHARFINAKPDNLWPQGTYWHLDTRPDEFEKLDDDALKNCAAAIDARLNASPFQTLVHGDAKLANFCFSPNGENVAAVDFQYVGGGCGMKDLAYFVGSCLDENECEQQETYLLNHYFSTLKSALSTLNATIDLDHLEQDWRSLYPVAWTDFHRFLKGWSPGHWKINSYSERLAKQVISECFYFE